MTDKFDAAKPENRPTEDHLQMVRYVPEEQLFERIPLCRFLSDLSLLFEDEDPAGKAEEGEKR
ncbi:MAG: hypothetical protein A4E72_00594 [Syntrophus sp. PtaU1.Bin208]|nr:MAG: hypothetical protein A4E72_00594 [Syntrophus sp. PtaU1.Bin208]